MNEVTRNEPKMQIAAVVFMKLTYPSMVMEISSEKPYFYLDTVGVKVNDLALVDSPNNFGIVKVMRLLPADNEAVLQVTKPLLCRVDYDPALVSGANAKLVEFKSRTTDFRVQKLIDKELKDGEVSSEDD